jgi:hypothetical protein
MHEAHPRAPVGDALLAEGFFEFAGEGAFDH